MAGWCDCLCIADVYASNLKNSPMDASHAPRIEDPLFFLGFFMDLLIPGNCGSVVDGNPHVLFCCFPCSFTWVPGF